MDHRGPKRFAYADPPYLGMGAKLYGEHHPDAALWDSEQAHRDLCARLLEDYPDGFVISLHEPSLALYLDALPAEGRHLCIWHKTFAAFKANVRVAYTWEPVLLVGGRRSSKDGALPCRDVLSAPIALQRGLPGAKPERFASWVLDLLGWTPADQVDDLFPGTGVLGRVIGQRAGLPSVHQLNLWDGESVG